MWRRAVRQAKAMDRRAGRLNVSSRRHTRRYGPVSQIEGALNSRQYLLLDLSELGLIALVEGPLLDALCPDQPCSRQDLKVFAGRRLADAELSRDQQPADSILDQVPIDLRREVFPRLFEPFQDSPPADIGKRAESLINRHIDN